MGPKRKREVEFHDWSKVLAHTAFALEHLHPALGTGWTAVLEEACCVRPKNKKKSNASTPANKGPLRLASVDDFPPHDSTVLSYVQERCGLDDVKKHFMCVRSIAFLKWCRARGYEFRPETFVAAIHLSNREVLQWLADEGCPMDMDALCFLAGAVGSITALDWLFGRGNGNSEDALKEVHSAFAGACCGGNVHVLKWLIKNNIHREPDWTDGRLITIAINRGHLDVLEFLRTCGCPLSDETCTLAAQSGHLNILKYVRKLGCAWNVWTTAAAAAGGHLDVLKWARSEGCPWDAKTCSNAATGGHLGVLKWARSEGCPWDWGTRASALENGHQHILQYAHENGCPWHEWMILYCPIAQAAARMRSNIEADDQEALLDEIF